MAMNLCDLFYQTVRKQPARPALLGPGADDALSYQELGEAIASAGSQLQRAGLRPGDCVGLHLPSGVDYIIFNYAIWRCGGCVVPIPVELAAAEKEQICRGICLSIVVSARRTLSFLGPLRGSGLADLARGMAAVPVASLRAHPPGFRDLGSAFIRFTSGTTAASKGVVLSHETIHDRIQAANEVLHIGPDDRIIWLLSMSYHFAVSIVNYLSFGATIVLPSNHFAPAIIDSTRGRQGTLVYGSPVHYAWLAECERPAPLESLRLALSTTTALDLRAAEQFHRRFGLPVTQALGVIEVGLPFINIDFAADRPGAVGRALPAYRVRMADVGLGPGLQEVHLSGKGFLDAYYQPWQPRADIMPDGWFRTGDVGELDADGCLFLHGRTKDVINVLGMKFFPQEVESVLMSHPRVGAASVFPRGDDRLGEVASARVVVKAGPEGLPSQGELLAYCKERLAGYKVPQLIEFVDRLPRTASGKVLHRQANVQAQTNRDGAEMSLETGGFCPEQSQDFSRFPEHGGNLPRPEPSTPTPPRDADRQGLVPTDRAMLSVDRALRDLGYPGFETQMLLWLAGRADEEGLRAGISRLSRSYPVTASRLVEAGNQGGPCWQFRAGAECTLRVAHIGSSEPQAVLDFAGRILSTPADPTWTDPIRFYLLHRPDGRDVVLVQYNHTLMDNHAALRVLQCIDRFSRAVPDRAGGPQANQADSIRQYLRRFSRQRRLRAAAATADLWGQSFRGGVAMLGRSVAAPPGPGQLRIVGRCLGEHETTALQSRVVEVCGYPSLSMALVASAFRAIGRLSPQRWPGGCNLVAGIGVDLGLRGHTRPIFQNLVSLVPIRARSENLEDRDELVQILSRQLLERLEQDADLGMVQLVTLFSRRPRQERWAIDLVLHLGFSLWYAYFGSQDALGEHFAGAALETVSFAGPAWPPVGVTLLVNQFRGRLWFQVTYVPESVPESLANHFLDQVLSDLVK
jgi:long-chain acyl-CoA synthetase